MLAVALGVIGVYAEQALLDNTVSCLEIKAGLLTANTGGRNGVTATDLGAGDLAAVLGGDGTAVTIIDPAGATLAAEPNGAPEAVAGARLSADQYATVLSEIAADCAGGLRRRPRPRAPRRFRMRADEPSAPCVARLIA